MVRRYIVSVGRTDRKWIGRTITALNSFRGINYLDAHRAALSDTHMPHTHTQTFVPDFQFILTLRQPPMLKTPHVGHSKIRAVADDVAALIRCAASQSCVHPGTVEPLGNLAPPGKPT